MSRSISIYDIEKMLMKCANGYEMRMATHSRVITYKQRVFRAFPKYDEIEIGYVRKLVRNLEIDKDCAKKYLAI